MKVEMNMIELLRLSSGKKTTKKKSQSQAQQEQGKYPCRKPFKKHYVFSAQFLRRGI
jgi:hypothetical protein